MKIGARFWRHEKWWTILEFRNTFAIARSDSGLVTGVALRKPVAPSLPTVVVQVEPPAPVDEWPYERTVVISPSQLSAEAMYRFRSLQGCYDACEEVLMLEHSGVNAEDAIKLGKVNKSAYFAWKKVYGIKVVKDASEEAKRAMDMVREGVRPVEAAKACGISLNTLEKHCIRWHDMPPVRYQKEWMKSIQVTA